MDPRPEIIRDHLEHLFGHVAEEYPTGLVEIAWCDGAGKLSQAKMFLVDALDAATEHAVKVNAGGANTYVGVNPRRSGTPNERANGNAIEAAFHNFIDLDGGEAVEAFKERSSSLPCSFLVVTGRRPSPRLHAYWRLQEASLNLDAWGREQEALASHFTGDAVKDPPRVMRLAGTVSYPSEKKCARGYQRELTELQCDPDRDPVEAVALMAAYPPKKTPAASTNIADRLGVNDFDITKCLEEIGLGQNLHNNARDIAAHLIGTNHSEWFVGDYLKRVLQPVSDGGTVQELPELIKSAKQKFSRPAPAFETILAEELMAIELPEPKFIVDGLIAQGASLLAGRPKVGKSWMALNLAIAVASGDPAFGAAAVKKGGVLYLALEDNLPRLKKRLTINLDGATVPEDLHFATAWPPLDHTGGDRLRQWLEAHPDTHLAIIDTLARMRPMEKRHDNPYQADYRAIEPFKTLADEFGIAVLILHHLRKSPSDDPLDLISGTYGLSAAADGALVLQRQRNSADATLFVTGRDIEECERAMSFDAGTGQWSLLGDAQDYRKTQERGAILDILRNNVEPLAPKDIAALLDEKENTIRQRLVRMASAGDVVKKEYGKYAAPPLTL